MFLATIAACAEMLPMVKSRHAAIVFFMSVLRWMGPTSYCADGSRVYGRKAPVLDLGPGCWGVRHEIHSGCGIVARHEREHSRRCAAQACRRRALSPGHHGR